MLSEMLRKRLLRNITSQNDERCSSNVGVMITRRLQQRAIITPTLDEHLMLG